MDKLEELLKANGLESEKAQSIEEQIEDLKDLMSAILEVIE